MTTKRARKTIMLIDGYGLIFRAYHAIDSAMATSSGEQTNAVFGFARMLLDVIDNQRPDYAVVALEGGRTFRHDAYEGYKATRAEMPEDLRSQIGRVRELIEALNIPIEQREGYEADDVIGSMARSCAADENLHVLIVTGDSDLLQLVDEHVDVVLPGRPRFQDLRLFDRPAVVERYGFEPELIPDFKALVGESSDNIVGVPGIGEKTATALIVKFGDIEEILAHVEDVTPPRARNALIANVDQLRESRRLTTIVQDLAIACDLDRSAVDNFDRERIVALFRDLEFRSLVARLPSRSAPEAAAVPVERPQSKRTIVRDAARLVAMADRVRAVGAYAVDVESTSTDPMLADLVGIAIAVSPEESWYVPFAHVDDDGPTPDLIRETFAPIFADAALRAYAHHGKYDLQVLRTAGFDLTNVTFDTMVAAYLLGENSVGLKDLAFTKLGIEMTGITELIGTGRAQLTMNMVSVDDAGDYACGDVEATFALTRLFDPLLAAQGQERIFNDIEMPLVPVLAEMERAGIAIDSDYLGGLHTEVQSRLAGLEAEMFELAGHELNINSTKQLATLLFDKLKLPSGRKTKTGYSVDADMLETIKHEHPIVELILEYKSLGKLQSTYIESLPKQVNPRTGRVHTSFNQTVAATGRLSSTNPNLQNIPIRTDLGRRVRQAFVADCRPAHRLFEDAVLMSADYSQIELRLMAHLSEEPFLIDSFNSGADIHRATASLVYGLEQELVSADMRRVAKTVNFGLLYGMQAYGLSRDTGLPRAEAQKFIDQYWARLPQVRRFFDETIRFGLVNGYVETMNGRRRLIPDLDSANGMRRLGAERMAVNMPVQGAAADIMKIAMVSLADALRHSPLRARLLLQVHDELVLEVARPDVEPLARLVRSTMEGAAQLRAPLVVDVAHGPNWEQMTAVDPR
ncbi:MAG: DNA polymerase I [Thermomicrobiales bacterium]